MPDLERNPRLNFIADCAVQACLAEINAKKPGNVHPGADFKNTSYEDYVSGSNALKQTILKSAVNGCDCAGDFTSIKIGQLVLEGATAVKKSHNAGNTHLGILLLFVPLAAAAGYSYSKDRTFDNLQSNVAAIVAGSTVDDALNLYDAIRIAAPGGLGKSRYDARKERSKEVLINEGLTFYDVMGKSAERDTLAAELVGGMPLVFDVGSPLIGKLHKGLGRLDDAIVQAYLSILSNVIDTLIVRKAGLQAAQDVSTSAAFVLEQGGVSTDEGRDAIKEFDRMLRVDGNKLNPGTTADIIAASLFVSLLNGLHNV